MQTDRSMLHPTVHLLTFNLQIYLRLSIRMQALPLVLDRITDPVTAVILSVTVVLLFGEIIPQAVCSSNGLEVGAFFTPLVKVLLIITMPLSIPISAVLDFMLGQRHTALFRRAELKTFVDMHAANKDFGGNLTSEEVKIIKGALDLTHKRAKAAMTPLDMVFMVSIDTVLDKQTLESILKSGHSRILVHKKGDRTKIIGIVLVKELILIDPNANQPVSSLEIRHIPHLLAETPMYDMLRLFKTGRTHIAVLTQPTRNALYKRKKLEEAVAIDVYSIEDGYDSEIGLRTEDEEEYLLEDTDQLETASSSSSSSADSIQQLEEIFNLEFTREEVIAVGIITIEDVLEELLGDEIIDETDTYVDNLCRTRVNKAALSRSLPPYLLKALKSTPAYVSVTVPGLQVYRMGSGSIRYGMSNAEKGDGAPSLFAQNQQNIISSIVEEDQQE